MRWVDIILTWILSRHNCFCWSAQRRVCVLFAVLCSHRIGIKNWKMTMSSKGHKKRTSFRVIGCEVHCEYWFLKSSTLSYMLHYDNDDCITSERDISEKPHSIASREKKSQRFRTSYHKICLRLGRKNTINHGDPHTWKNNKEDGLQYGKRSCTLLTSRSKCNSGEFDKMSLLENKTFHMIHYLYFFCVWKNM